MADSAKHLFALRLGHECEHAVQAFCGEIYASFFFVFVLMGMVVDKR